MWPAALGIVGDSGIPVGLYTQKDRDSPATSQACFHFNPVQPKVSRTPGSPAMRIREGQARH